MPKNVENSIFFINFAVQWIISHILIGIERNITKEKTW